MPDELEERLKSHARAFDSLLSLIPANLYYGGDVSDQWQRKKQTPEQKRAAKMAKLDPDNWKSAKDVMEERAAAATALKRKRDDDEDAESNASSPDDMPGSEPPKAVQDTEGSGSKKRKIDTKGTKHTDDTQEPAETEEERKQRRIQQKAAKRERKRERKVKAKEKLERQKAKKTEGQSTEDVVAAAHKKTKTSPKEVHLKEPISLDVQQKSLPERAADDQESSGSSSSEADQMEVFSPPHESTTSSTSSVQPAAIDETAETQQAEQKPQLPQQPQQASPNTNTSQTPRERLQAAISQLRAGRKADGTDGQAPKNRQELLDQRRRKEEEKKAAKKEQKRREREEEARRQDEEIARRFSPGGSGSLLASPRSPIIGDNGSATSGSNNFNFSYGRIAFEDGTRFDPVTAEVVEEHKKKGPRDPATALKTAQAKKERLSSLDEQKRLEIEQKDMWLNAKKRAHGEHVRDDTSLLKKALKRQQGQKRKSEREWTERLEGVQKSQHAKQRKRTENLAKRKEEKNSGGGGGVKKAHKVKRPGFEGSFKGRTGGKRKS